MKKLFISLIIVFITLGLYFLKIPINDGYYVVEHVSDGDTIVVTIDNKKETIRLIGVDTPETHHPNKPKQCYGDEASGFTTGSLLGRKVQLVADPLSDNRDRYDRLLRYVILEDQTDFNKLLIDSGYGFAVTGFNHSKLISYVNAQNNAEKELFGLWANCTIDRSGDYLMTSPNTS